jgi:hypothetical protein
MSDKQPAPQIRLPRGGILWTRILDAVQASRSHQVAHTPAGLGLFLLFLVLADLYVMALPRVGVVLSFIHPSPHPGATTATLALCCNFVFVAVGINMLIASEWWLFAQYTVRDLSLQAQSGSLGWEQNAVGAGIIVSLVTLLIGVVVGTPGALGMSVIALAVLSIVISLTIVCLVKDRLVALHFGISFAAFLLVYCLFLPSSLGTTYTAPGIPALSALFFTGLGVALVVALFPHRAAHRLAKDIANLDISITCTEDDPAYFEYSSTNLRPSMPTPINLFFRLQNANAAILARTLTETSFHIVDPLSDVGTSALDLHLLIWNLSVIQNRIGGTHASRASQAEGNAGLSDNKDEHDLDRDTYQISLRDGLGCF